MNQLLPILKERINTPATVRHCAKIIVKLTEKLNPGEVPIITADQPAYPIGKQVQWLYPHEFGSITWMKGPLYIETMFLNIIGSWLDKSGQKT